MTWPLVGAQVKQRSWPLLPLFKSEQLHSIESKASRYAKVPIYTCTRVCLAYISFADLHSVEAPTPSGHLQAHQEI